MNVGLRCTTEARFRLEAGLSFLKLLTLLLTLNMTHFPILLDETESYSHCAWYNIHFRLQDTQRGTQNK